MPELAPLARLEHAESLHVLDVGAGDESLVARPGQHDDPRLRVDGQLGEPVTKRVRVLDVERVQRLRPIDHDDRSPPSRSTRIAISRLPASPVRVFPPGPPS